MTLNFHPQTMTSFFFRLVASPLVVTLKTPVLPDATSTTSSGPIRTVVTRPAVVIGPSFDRSGWLLLVEGSMGDTGREGGYAGEEWAGKLHAKKISASELNIKQLLRNPTKWLLRNQTKRLLRNQ